ncbi:MAG: SDR family oxidoreductase [Alphaproteobacteria bacterium]|nr:SDR family oxidoreductase [Alphaproteobacteria bacterium]
MTIKTALVTGCSSGIGKNICERLLEDGWLVIGLSRRVPEFSTNKAHASFRHLCVDMLDAAALDLALNSVGSVDALIHAAGILRVGGFNDMDLEDGALMWRLHVDCSAQLVKKLASDIPQGGRIVFIGSRVANGAAGRSLYAATKSALIGFARSIALELAPRQITVNIVAPAATDTPMLRDKNRNEQAPILPLMGRYVQPEEVAGSVVFLLSPSAASITGQQLVICAGSSL